MELLNTQEIDQVSGGEYSWERGFTLDWRAWSGEVWGNYDHLSAYLKEQAYQEAKVWADANGYILNRADFFGY